MPTYKRAEVEFVRGEGARLWDSEGKEYLDFLTGISVCSVGHCHPAVVEAVREQAGDADPRLQPLPDRGRRSPGRAHLRVEPRRQGLPLQLRHRGERVRDQARPQARSRARHRASPRSWCWRAPFTAARWGRSRRRRGWPPNESFAPYLPGFVDGAARRPRCPARRGRRAHRGGDAGADPGGGRRPRDLRRRDRRRARGLRQARRPACPRRDPDRDGEDGLAVGLRAAPRAARRDHLGEGARRRAAGRRLRRRARRSPTRCSPATTARPSRAARWSRPPPSPPST